jgi:hypothetical protein
MPRDTNDDVRDAELIVGLNKARKIGDIAEMWRCAAELMAADQNRGARRDTPKVSAERRPPDRGRFRNADSRA